MSGNPIRILFLSVALFSVFVAKGQEISGTVYDAKTREPLPGAIATIRQEGKIIEYQSCDTEGKFAFEQFRQGAVLEVRHLGYNPFSAPCTPGSHSIFLEENSETINTAVVKAEKLTVRGDTLSYNVTALQSPADRNLQDLLKRIPGIQVSEQGYVKYGGKPISKFYIVKPAKAPLCDHRENRV